MSGTEPARMRLLRPVVWIVVAACAACAHGGRTSNPNQTAVPTGARPIGSAPSHAHPAATAAPSGTLAPSATPFPTPSSSLKPLSALLPPAPKHVPRVPPNAAPQILDVAISETTVHPGDRVFGRVTTTSNVASVEARIGTYAMSLVKVGVGRFELTYTVTPLPWFVHGNFTMEVIAHNTRGDTTMRAIPLSVR